MKDIKFLILLKVIRINLFLFLCIDSYIIFLLFILLFLYFFYNIFSEIIIKDIKLEILLKG
jgi:hypothetical protein